jgi:chromosome partitioning protein
MKLAIISRKGGSGKTTLAVNLAVAAELPVIDLDPQASAVIWSRRREVPRPTVTSANAVTLSDVLGGSFIIDTPPHQDTLALAAARAADACLLPLKPTQHDLDQLQPGLDVAMLAGRPLAIILTQTYPTAQHRELIEQLRQSGLTVCPIQLRQRNAYIDAFAAGRGVTEVAGNAADEVHGVLEWVRKWLDKS